MNVPTAGDLPVTRGMLGAVRTELLERIDESKGELRREIQEVKGELLGEIHQVKSELHQVKGELLGEIHQVKSDIHGMKADIHGVKADIHGMKADMARIALLVEEQNARNKVVLDGIVALMTRQERQEHRMDKVEETVRGLASAHSSG